MITSHLCNLAGHEKWFLAPSAESIIMHEFDNDMRWPSDVPVCAIHFRNVSVARHKQYIAVSAPS